MKPDTLSPAERPSAADCAEAAAWIAKLHGEERTAKVEAGFRRWHLRNCRRNIVNHCCPNTAEIEAAQKRVDA